MEVANKWTQTTLQGITDIKIKKFNYSIIISTPENNPPPSPDASLTLNLYVAVLKTEEGILENKFEFFKTELESTSL